MSSWYINQLLCHILSKFLNEFVMLWCSERIIWNSNVLEGFCRILKFINIYVGSWHSSMFMSQYKIHIFNDSQSFSKCFVTLFIKYYVWFRYSSMIMSHLTFMKEHHNVTQEIIENRTCMQHSQLNEGHNDTLQLRETLNHNAWNMNIINHSHIL